jgi:hypothetical protein
MVFVTTDQPATPDMRPAKDVRMMDAEGKFKAVRDSRR